MKKKLSILICSIVGRESLLKNLRVDLERQRTDDVEILVETDDKRITTGAKRNVLLRRATGDYIAFVDDDDKVSDDYVRKILKAIKTHPDCCGIEGEISHTKQFRISRRSRRSRRFEHKQIIQKFVHSIQYDRWFEKGGIYYRCPNHINPVKRTIALKVKFPDVMRGEDKDYSFRLRFLLKSEVYIDGIIYFYRAS